MAVSSMRTRVVEEALALLLLVASGCTCTKGADQRSDAAVPDAALDAGPDLRDHGADATLWPRDIGPVPDANTAPRCCGLSRVWRRS